MLHVNQWGDDSRNVMLGLSATFHVNHHDPSPTARRRPRGRYFPMQKALNK